MDPKDAKTDKTAAGTGLPDVRKISIEGPVTTTGKVDWRVAAATQPNPMWIAIRNRRLGFQPYSQFINRVFADPAKLESKDPRREYFAKGLEGVREPSITDCVTHGFLGHGINAYELLKTATEIFLLLECGVFIARYQDGKNEDGSPNWKIPGAESDRFTGPLDLESLKEALKVYLGKTERLPYIDRIVSQTTGLLTGEAGFFDGVLKARTDCPCFLELIWSYWHEEGMLVQSMNALSLRFQNRRLGDGRDPLAQLELSPLRPLSSIFWGYVQDEQHRLSLARRNHEYEHEYGAGLRGKAVPAHRSADRRSKFIAAFHDLLYRCAAFYRDSANTQYDPDPFPLLTGLKEVHLILSQGAGNQFGDLPWTARVEMLMQQWILARPEIREFLGRRPMVAYEEDWMPNADAMKTVMGWTDTSIVHFHNLAVFGEQILLSIRWHLWATENNAERARDWAKAFKPEIQSYLFAYRAATGVDLDGQATPDRTQTPSILLERRLADQRRENASP